MFLREQKAPYVLESTWLAQISEITTINRDFRSRTDRPATLSIAIRKSATLSRNSKGGRCESTVCLSTSARGLSGVRRLQISSLRLSPADKCSSHWVANLFWASFSSTQKGFVSRFSVSTRKSRNDKWSSRIG